MPELDDFNGEFDHRWANAAEHKEPSARARMLAARWKDNPPDPAPFRADPDPVRPRRSAWTSTAMVFGCVLAVIVLLGWAQMQAMR
ncbi:hypothetical protein C3489_34675 [Streptomyces sp. Ru71]|uniref:SCO2583/SCO2584 N-terminal domain-containing protein n=1 Tax=Streptomyces sp. Ru71 TaxID=2080746 RepID=UPI000CDD4E14|nr:hypothetical protein [Streptomyces sp. Ru71]POX45265.1 hypothetical protein C3489_34675 [Streptomyces sp. Ru71]